ncbi:MAG: T9SS type A sorting domain-containing protein [Flavobacteriales bacterium]|nr:MAG: T9SS type A sorting domain-containing protein [Flavobacteriales bacterium]
MRTIITTAAIAVASTATFAQPVLDITLAHTSGTTYEVRIRPDDSFDGVFSSLVFTLRWNAADGIGITQFDTPASDRIGIAPAAPVANEASYMYRTFSGFGFTPFTELGAAWIPGEEYALFTVTFSGTGNVELVNDDWTAANNGDFYVSLNGEPRAGNIYATEITTLVESTTPFTPPALSVWPNPTDGPVRLDLQGFSPGPIEVYVHDATGKLVLRTRVTGPQADIDVGALTSGTYQVSARQRSTTMRSPMVVH